MARPDVRVRLSAEGVAEVVGALKRVQAEGGKAAAKSKRGFGGLNKVLGSTKGLIGGLGIAVGFVTFKRLISGAIEAGDQLNKMGAKVGATTEHLSALQLVARTSDADLNQVGSALIKMNKNIGDAAAGIPTAAGHIADLGLSLKDFKGKDSVEIFALISKELAGVEDQAKQTRIAVGLFGRSGAMLLPTMNALADEGLANVISRAEELGVLITQDLAAATEQIKDDVEILKMQSEAMGINFMAGFGPAMSQMLATLSGDIGKTTTAWKDFGTGLGAVLKFVVGIVAAAVDAVTTLMGALAVTLMSAGKTIALALTGNFKGAKREMATFDRFMKQEMTDIGERMKGRFELVLNAPKAPAGTATGSTGATGTGEEVAELAARRAQAQQIALDKELSLIKKAAATKTKEEKREFANALQSVEEYYGDRRGILTEQLDEELRVLAEKRALLDAEIDPARRQQEEAKIDSAEALVRLNNAEAVAAVTEEERKTVRDLAQERLDLEVRLLQMQGDRTAAQRLGFEEELRAVDELYRKRGESDAAREAAVARLRAALEAGVDFEDAKDEAEAAVADLATARADIQAQADAGLMAQIVAEGQILEIEQERLGTLRALAEALLIAAEATGDPAKIAQAQDYSAAIAELGHNVEAAGAFFAEFEATALDSTASALEDFLTDGISGSKSLADAFSDMAMSIIADLKRLVAQLIIAKIFGAFTSSPDTGGSSGTVVVAGGGYVRGPGTTTSDSILAALSDREFVTRAWAVDQPGVLSHLRAINKYGAKALAVPSVVQLPAARFAEGGLVGPDEGAKGAGLDGKLILGLEDGLVVREIATPAGTRAVMELLHTNKRAARSALGIG